MHTCRTRIGGLTRCVSGTNYAQNNFFHFTYDQNNKSCEGCPLSPTLLPTRRGNTFTPSFLCYAARLASSDNLATIPYITPSA